MTINVDAATITVVILLAGNLCALVFSLARLGQITKTHSELHREHRMNIERLDLTQREHDKTIAEHTVILESRSCG